MKNNKAPLQLLPALCRIITSRKLTPSLSCVVRLIEDIFPTAALAVQLRVYASYAVLHQEFVVTMDEDSDKDDDDESSGNKLALVDALISDEDAAPVATPSLVNVCAWMSSSRFTHETLLSDNAQCEWLHNIVLLSDMCVGRKADFDFASSAHKKAFAGILAQWGIVRGRLNSHMMSSKYARNALHSIVDIVTRRTVMSPILVGWQKLNAKEADGDDDGVND
jgi:hypothetical protein